MSTQANQYIRAVPLGPHADAYDYQCGDACPVRGQIVRVPLGRQEVVAVVTEVDVEPVVDRSKIRSILEAYPYTLPESLLKTLWWASTYNVAPIGQFLKATLGSVDLTHNYRARKQDAEDNKTQTPLTLNEHQKVACSLISQGFALGKRVALLDGVTGSGKTEVYLEFVYERWSAGGQVLVCVPEIGLTPAWIDRFEKRFGQACAVWHSRMTPAQRWHVWKRVILGEPIVVIAARSGVFLPFSNLKLIVMDEEHDGSYKQEDPPVYHCRDLILARSHFGGVDVILSSATPSLETYLHAKEGKYTHAVMHNRVGKSTLPTMATVDMKKQPRKDEAGKDQWLHADVITHIKKTLEEGAQVFLFLNRRGYAPLLMCGSCGHRFGCPQCSTSLVMHASKRNMQCHHCGFVQAQPTHCPECSEVSLIPCGPGIERLESYAKDLFPEKNVAVVSSDHIASPKEMLELTEAITAKNVDIVIGTQMLAKGHHFPDLTCVVVVDADAGLMTEDWRACEKTYQLIHQVAGRAGRGDRPGQVFIQTFQPEHPVFDALCRHDRDAAYEMELLQRKQGGLTPFGRMLAVVVSAPSAEDVKRWANYVRQQAPLHPDVRIFGPAPAPLERIRNSYRWRFLIQAKPEFPLSNYASTWMQSCKIPRSIRVKMDMDPQSFL